MDNLLVSVENWNLDMFRPRLYMFVSRKWRKRKGKKT